MESNVSRWVLVSMIMASAASAQTRQVTPEDVGCGCSEPLNRFGLNYRAGFNITAKFKHLGGFASASNPGPAPAEEVGNANRIYDDGYNRVDSSGNAGGFTSFWGYDHSSQYDPSAFNNTGSITMHSSSASGTANSKNQEDDPQHGVELTYNRELGKIGSIKWGIEGAVNYTDLTIHNDGNFFTDAQTTSDTFALNGVIPPEAPYHATFEQESGPVLSSNPSSRTTDSVANGALISGRHNFDADMYGLRLGPYVEIPICPKFAVSLSGGLAAVWVNSQFKYQESLSVGGSAGPSSHGNGSHDDVLPGGYVGGNLLFAINQNINLAVGAQYQSVGTYTHKENGRVAQLDLGNSVFLTAGLGFSF
jgi:hypothetical protein